MTESVRDPERMNVSDLNSGLDAAQAGLEMHALASQLYPICRSITGAGVRETLKVLQQHIALAVHEVPTGTQVFDWTVPREWNIRDAYIKNSRGEKVVDFQKCNLHVMSYSTRLHAKLRLEELTPHLFTLPEHPEWIPYRTSYYTEDWGFCLSHSRWSELEDDEYEVCIDSSLQDGFLTYGEYYRKGETEEEILISCHICHPSLCNDNLSGISLATQLAQRVARASRRYSYRFLFIPGTIGSITWLALNRATAARIKHGLVVVCVGDGGRFTYKKSRRGDAEVDQAAAHVLKHSGAEYALKDFSPYGYDERQYCSPGFNLAVGSLSRSPHGTFPQYHTSADNLEFIQPQYLAASLQMYLAVLDVLECNRSYLSQNQYCEPQLGKRGLYKAIGGHAESRSQEMAMLWVCNLSDGNYSLLDIAERSGLAFSIIKSAADLLVAKGLLKASAGAPPA
jgi:aminopeptidase-like protein